MLGWLWNDRVRQRLQRFLRRGRGLVVLAEDLAAGHHGDRQGGRVPRRRGPGEEGLGGV